MPQITLGEFLTGRSAVEKARMRGYFQDVQNTDDEHRARTREAWEAILARELKRPTR